MKASKEAKSYLSKLRRFCGKKNGVIPGRCFDDLRLMKLLEVSRLRSKLIDLEERKWE